MIVLLLAALPALGGCHMRQWFRGDRCETRAPFRKAQSVPALRMPEGLPSANTRNGLKIPDEVGPAVPRAANQKCLDEPPNFYADRPVPAPMPAPKAAPKPKPAPASAAPVPEPAPAK
jgi:hypothetical protein